jgi:tetratricopeptide (TPR) repeat protein
MNAEENREPWLAQAHRGVLNELSEWWEDVVAGTGSCVVRVPVETDWGHEGVLTALTNRLIDAQPADEQFFGRLSTGVDVLQVNDKSANPSFLAFKVRCAPGVDVAQPDLIAFQKQLSAWQEDIVAVPSPQRPQGGLWQLQAAAEILAAVAGATATGIGLTAVSALKGQYQSAAEFKLRYNVYSLKTRRTDSCAHALAHLSRSLPILVTVDAAEYASPEFIGLLTEMIDQPGSRILVVAVHAGGAVPVWVQPMRDRVSIYHVDPTPSDARILKTEAQRWLGSPSSQELLNAVTAQVNTLGGLGRLVETPSIVRARSNGTLRVEDLASWRDPSHDLTGLEPGPGRVLTAAALIGPLAPIVWINLLDSQPPASELFAQLEQQGLVSFVTADLVQFRSESLRLAALDAASRFLTATERHEFPQFAARALAVALDPETEASPAARWLLAYQAARESNPPIGLIEQTAESAASAGAFRTATALRRLVSEGPWQLDRNGEASRWRRIASGKSGDDPVSVVVNGLLALSCSSLSWEQIADEVAASLSELSSIEDGGLLARWWLELADRFADHGETDRAQDAASRAGAACNDPEIDFAVGEFLLGLASGYVLSQRLLDRLTAEYQAARKAQVPEDALADLHQEILMLAYQLGHWEQALHNATLLCTTRERVLGPDHPDTLTSRNNLAGCLEWVGRAGAALPLYEQTLTDRARVLGPDHPDTLTSRNNLAGCLESVGRAGEALLLYEQNLTDQERVLGPDHPDTLTSRNNLAACLESVGRAGEALLLYEQNLTDQERVLGPDHPDTLTSRNNLAGCLESVGRAGEALLLYEQNLTDQERVLGPDHPDTLNSRNNLAACLESVGRAGEALLLCEQNLTDQARVLGPDHPDTLNSRNNLAGCLESVGRAGEALLLYEQNLTDRERVLGPDHPATLNSRNNLAACLESVGRAGEALPLYEQTLTDRERVLGPDHPDTLSSRNDLAGCLASMANGRDGGS